MKASMYSNFLVEEINYKQNFIALTALDTETKFSGYVVVGKGDEVSHCEPRGVYNVCTGGSRWIGEGLSTLSYHCLDRDFFSRN